MTEGFSGLECSLFGIVEGLEGLTERLKQMGATIQERVEEHSIYAFAGEESVRSSSLLHGYVQRATKDKSTDETRICHYSPGDPNSLVTVINLVETKLYSGDLDKFFECIGYRFDKLFGPIVDHYLSAH